MVKQVKSDLLILLIVGVVAMVGVGVLLFNTGTGSGDISGQASSATRTRATCADNDGGSDSQEYTLGITTGTWKGTTQTKSYTDNCKDTTTINEGLCVTSSGVQDTSFMGTTAVLSGAYAYYDEINCDEGYCLDGVCSTGCYDDDNDEGNPGYYSVKGETTDLGTVETDECQLLGANNQRSTTTLTEYYCVSGERVSGNKLCSDVDEDYVCSDGACIADACSDSDGGKKALLYGEATTLSGEEGLDTCSSDGITLTEYYCEGAEITSSTVDCSSLGKVCAGGQCVAAPTCTDTDGGEDFYEQGTTTGYEITASARGGYSYTADTAKTDTCAGSNEGLVEYWCDASLGITHYTTYACADEDKICSDGACVECTQDDNSMCGAGYKCSRRGTCYTTCDSASAGANECRIREGYQCTDDVTGTNGCYLECDSAADCLSGYRCSGGWCVETP